MSIGIMSLVFKANIGDLTIGKKKVTAPILKFILVALADHCNDEGDGAYPSLTTLEHKTALSHQSVLNALEALKTQGFIIRAGISKRGTTNYSLNVPMLKSLVHLVDYLGETSQPGLMASTPGSAGSTPGGKTSTPGVPESSLTILKPSIKQETPKIQNSPPEFTFWDTLLEIIQADREIPPANWRKIALGKPIAFQDKVLTIGHPEPLWANARFAKTFTNLVQGLCPGASVQFTAN